MDLRILKKVTHGMYILSSKNNLNKINAQISDSVMQITFNPPKIAVSVNNKNLTCDFIKESNLFCISILDEKFPLKNIEIFGFKSGREINKFENLNYSLTINGLPYLTDTIGFLECKVIDKIDVGTHTLFIGEVINYNLFNDNSPMTYLYYYQNKKNNNFGKED